MKEKNNQFILRTIALPTIKACYLLLFLTQLRQVTAQEGPVQSYLNTLRISLYNKEIHEAFLGAGRDYKDNSYLTAKPYTILKLTRKEIICQPVIAPNVGTKH